MHVTPAPPGARAVQYLQPLVEAENATLPLELIASEKKSPDKNKSKYAQLVSAIKSSHSGVIVGCLLKASSALRRRRPGCERLGAGLGLPPFSVHGQPERCVSARRVPQEKPQGEFAALWKEALAADTELEQVELNAALADIMSTKDATEQVTAVLARVAQLRPSPSPNPSPESYPNPSPSPKPPCTHAARA